MRRGNARSGRSTASLGLLLFLAWKALGENGLSLILLLLAVAVGVGFQIPNRANLAGFRDEIMRQEVSSGLGQVRVRPRRGERFLDVTDMMASIARLPSVKAVEPILILPGAIRGGGHFVVLGITGVSASAGQRPYERTVGADLVPGDNHGTVLGERLAKQIGVSVGDDVEIQPSKSRNARAALRLRRIGFVFQQSNLMPFLSARDNVALPAWRLSGSRRSALAQADALLDRFGLSVQARAPGGVLSLGEAQRVATARALVNRAAIILADEPTGSLDSASTEAVLDTFDEIVREGTTLLVATHDSRVASRMHRMVHMQDGALVDQPIPTTGCPSPFIALKIPAGGRP